jgi:hypothetical protein
MPDRDWPASQRADWELRDMRVDLERTLSKLPADAVRARVLREKLDAVKTEQQSREPARRNKALAELDQ